LDKIEYMGLGRLLYQVGIYEIRLFIINLKRVL
jgi:hypothetical protein